MANVNQSPKFVTELSSLSLYKKTQGRLTRQLTFLAVVVGTVCACYQLSATWLDLESPAIRTGLPILLGVVMTWLAFRAVNYPPFAEFLISVQAEVAKVNWPSWGELKRATIVVIFAMFFLGAILFAYDFLWYKVLSLVGVLQV
ncbi:MAG: preprotein translocase subunit SecE [Planctomycetota bacterium]